MLLNIATEEIGHIETLATAVAVIEELGVEKGLPILKSFPQAEEDQRNSDDFDMTSLDKTYPEGRWTQGPSIDGKGKSIVFRNETPGEAPVSGPARPDSGAQAEQIGKP